MDHSLITNNSSHHKKLLAAVVMVLAASVQHLQTVMYCRRGFRTPNSIHFVKHLPVECIGLHGQVNHDDLFKHIRQMACYCRHSSDTSVQQLSLRSSRHDVRYTFSRCRRSVIACMLSHRSRCYLFVECSRVAGAVHGQQHASTAAAC